jgi:hypothetical protein
MAEQALLSCKDNPRRAPHWRWLRAMQIDGGGPRASRKRDGEDGFTWIRRAVRLKRHYAQAGNRTEALYALMFRDNDLFWAHSIWADDKEPTRWGIEARVLAGETDEEIAEKVGTEPAVINSYINVFFDVRGKMRHTDYMINVVMANAVTRGLQERHYDLLWKLLGYHGGTHVLNAVINKFTHTERPDNPEGVSNFFQDFAVNAIKYKAAIAALTVQANTHTQLPLIDSYVKYVEIEKNTENASKAHNTIVDNIGAMLSALPFRVGTKLDSEPIKMLPFDTGAAELNNAEMMVVATGGKLEHQPTIENLRFPGE